MAVILHKGPGSISQWGFFLFYFFLYRPRFALVLFFLGLAMGIILFFFLVVEVTSLAFLNSYSLL